MKDRNNRDVPLLGGPDHAQLILRNRIAEIVMADIEGNGVGYVDGAVACMGAAAAVAALLPLDAREALIAQLLIAWPQMVDARARDIRDGSFDDQLHTGRPS